jgi:hypothetical protein
VSKTRALLVACLFVSGAIAVTTAGLADNSAPTKAVANLNQARYLPDGKLQYPENAESWTALGASIGGDYAEGEFDPQRPGVIGVTQIEPNALRVLRETGHYPDGTMLLLTFYKPQSKTEPQLRGFVQGEVQQREIHVIDRTRFPKEGRAFFVFPGTTSTTASALAPGSVCVECHAQHGQLDATFAQFYPPIRHLTKSASAAAAP